MRKILIWCLGLISILILILYTLKVELLSYCLISCSNILWIIFCKILKFNAFVASLILLDLSNRLLKLIYAVRWARQSFIEILPPRYEANGTVIAATCFLIQVTSFLMLHRLVKLWTFFTDPRDILFRVIWYHPSRSFLEVFWFWARQFCSYLKYMFIWIISGIPPRILRMLHIWHKDRNNNRAWVIYVPYLERLETVASKHCLYYIQNQFQLNPYKKRSGLFWESLFHFAKLGVTSKPMQVDKLNTQLNYIKRGEIELLEKMYNIDSIPEEVKEYVRSVHASQGPKHLSKSKREWHGFDSRAREQDAYLAERLGWADAKREQEMLLEFQYKQREALKSFKNQYPKLPENTSVWMARHLGSRQHHPVIENVGVVNYSNKRMDANYISTSNYQGVLNTVNSKNPDFIQQIVLEPVKSLMLPGAPAPVMLVCPKKNIFKPDIDNFRNFVKNSEIQQRVLDRDFPPRLYEGHYIQHARQELDAALTGEACHVQLSFADSTMQDYYEHLVGAYDGIDITNLKRDVEISNKAVKAALLLRSFEQHESVLADTIVSQRNQYPDNSDSHNQ